MADDQVLALRECPRCGNFYTGYPALSRRDNKTAICSSCGTDEAMREYYGIAPKEF